MTTLETDAAIDRTRPIPPSDQPARLDALEAALRAEDAINRAKERK